jgi:hypothetical protein
MTSSDDYKTGLDDVMRTVVAKAAELVQRDLERTSLRESLIEGALIEAWKLHAADGPAARGELLPVPDWDPEPKHTDFVAARPDETFPSIVAEVKVDELDQTLWDLFKVLSIARTTASVKRCYLVVAGYPSRWKKVQCAELYDPRVGTGAWDSAAMFVKWREAWEYLLREGTGRPKRVHAAVRTSFIWGGPVPAFIEDGYELRCIAVESVADAGWLDFDGGWPRVEV